MSSLLDRYIAEDPAVIACYAGSIKALFGSAPEAEPWAPSLVESVRAFNADMDHHPEFRGDEPVVITGQQPALFAGPLYSVYKAITTIQLAERLSRQFETRVVPIFWVGSEDHDFDEAATVHFPTRKHTTDPVTLPMRPEYEGKALHQIPVNEDYESLIDTLVESCNGGEFRPEVEQFLRESLAASSSLADWSTRILARFFRDTPLVFFAPHLDAARKCSAAVIRRAIKRPLAVTRAVNDGAVRMDRLGHPAQVEKNDNDCAFFYEINGARAKVTWNGDTFSLPEIGSTMTEADLLEALESHPERFSPNVALRCIVQQHLFPTAAYVAGPGELAYWGQFKGVFDAFNAHMPVVYPRVRAILTTTKLKKLCNKYELVNEDLFVPEQELLTKALSKIDKSPAITMVASTRTDVSGRLDKLAEELARTTPVASDMARNLSAELKSKLNRLEQNVLYADETRRIAVENHVRRIQAILAPSRKPQERMHCVVPYLFEHGWSLCGRLMDELSVDNHTVQEVEL